jgi:diaminopimelate epimerase
MRFAKGHGTANDFVILPDVDDRVRLTPELVAALCDRRRGIGGDGVLRVVRRGGGWFMDYWNADGSLAEMCGNGTRVFARYLVESGLEAGGEITFGTRAGDVVAVVGPSEVSVLLGIPKEYGESAATVAGRRYPGTAVDCGNPHLVCAVDDVSTVDLSRAPGYDAGFFPDGVNVEFATFESGPAGRLSAVMRVYERGAGETMSCGTGAVAVAAVALRRAGVPTGSVTVDVPGGRLTVTLDGRSCVFAGPAVIVGSGEVVTASLASTGR